MVNMLQRNILLSSLTLLLLLVAACSDFDEMKSQKIYNQAERLLEKGEDGQAESLLVQLVNQYPKTQMAIQASQRLDQLHKNRAREEREAFAKVLRSYQQVFNGYYSVYADYPKSLQEFDNSGFFFDSDYLAEITSEGFQVYLWFTGGKEGFRAWCIKDEGEQGYAVTGRSQGLAPFDRQKTINYLETEFQISQQVGRIHVLSPRS